MCRIAGYAGPQSNRRTALVLRGLIMAEEKGNPHGTGVVTRNLKSRKNTLMKKGIRGRSYLVRGHADFLLEKVYNYAFVHVRYMTTGEQSDRCSHPFGFRVKGAWHFAMHNGVFSDELCDKLCGEFGCSKAKVDSETFFWALRTLQERGKSLEEAVTEVTGFISGSGQSAEYAFAYMMPDAVYLWRSEGRPLAVFDLRERHMGRWFASTEDMFKKALRIAGADFKKVEGFDLKPFRLYKVGHRTTPVWEVDMVCDLPKPPPRKTLYDFSSPSRFSRTRGEPLKAEPGMLFDEYDNVHPDYGEQGFYGERFPGEDEMDEMMEEFDLPDPETLSNRELNKIIGKISDEISLFGPDPDLNDYLADAIYEREKRKREGQREIQGKAEGKEKAEGEGKAEGKDLAEGGRNG